MIIFTVSNKFHAFKIHPVHTYSHILLLNLCKCMCQVVAVDMCNTSD